MSTGGYLLTTLFCYLIGLGVAALVIERVLLWDDARKRREMGLPPRRKDRR